MTPKGVTPSQTVGPFFHPSLLHGDIPQHQLSRPNTAGERIRIEGQVFDGAGAVVPDAVLELWQANSDGRYRHPADTGAVASDTGFIGFARSATDDDGRYWFDTIKPGRVPFDAERLQAPHISITIFARGLLNHLLTRIYFEDEAANSADPILTHIPQARRATLLARRVEARDEVGVTYQFDIILQGDGETIFFNPI